jgi:hypothetical protein
MIQSLPAELQGTFKGTLKAEEESERAHIEAELAMLRSIRGTLEATKEYLQRSTDEEKTAIGRVLSFFRDHDEEDPGQGRGRREGRGNRGNTDVEQMVRTMIQEVDDEIRHLEMER